MAFHFCLGRQLFSSNGHIIILDVPLHAAYLDHRKLKEIDSNNKPGAVALGAPVQTPTCPIKIFPGCLALKSASCELGGLPKQQLAPNSPGLKAGLTAK